MDTPDDSMTLKELDRHVLYTCGYRKERACVNVYKEYCRDRRKRFPRVKMSSQAEMLDVLVRPESRDWALCWLDRVRQVVRKRKA